MCFEEKSIFGKENVLFGEICIVSLSCLCLGLCQLEIYEADVFVLSSRLPDHYRATVFVSIVLYAVCVCLGWPLLLTYKKRQTRRKYLSPFYFATANDHWPRWGLFQVLVFSETKISVYFLTNIWSLTVHPLIWKTKLCYPFSVSIYFFFFFFFLIWQLTHVA